MGRERHKRGAIYSLSFNIEKKTDADAAAHGLLIPTGLLGGLHFIFMLAFVSLSFHSVPPFFLFILRLG